MSLSAFTLIEVDNTLQVVNAAVREAIEGTLAVQSSLTRADGEAEEHVGVVLVVYMTKEHLGQVITAKEEWTLQHGIEISDVYLEEVCGDLHRQWLFNSGCIENHQTSYEALHTYIRKQVSSEAFMHTTNICDVLADFMTLDTGCLKGDVDIFPFAGWLGKYHPKLYASLCDLPMNYGQLQTQLYGEVTGAPF